MSEKLRFTGEWPLLTYWDEYPNWEYALDEEGEDGQDETTLRPSVVQDYIDEQTAFTAGDAECADGSKLLALLEISYDRKPDAVSVFINDEDARRIYYSVPDKKWMPFIQDWLPESERCPAISMDDSNIFPLTVTSRLPRERGGERHCFIVNSDGTLKHLV